LRNLELRLKKNAKKAEAKAAKKAAEATKKKP
jgi:hypothetical protein